MALLLDQRGAEIKITEEVVKAATWNKKHSEEIMALLLDRHGGDLQITAEEIKVVVENHNDGKVVQ